MAILALPTSFSDSTVNGTELSGNGTSSEHAISRRAVHVVEQDLDLGDLEDEFERDEYIKTLSGDDKCKAKFWKCTGKVVKGSMHYADEPGGVWG